MIKQLTDVEIAQCFTVDCEQLIRSTASQYRLYGLGWQRDELDADDFIGVDLWTCRDYSHNGPRNVVNRDSMSPLELKQAQTRERKERVKLLATALESVDDAQAQQLEENELCITDLIETPKYMMN